MGLGLRNAIVLVTGGSKGIGFACAEAFLTEGARVAIGSRPGERRSGAERPAGGHRLCGRLRLRLRRVEPDRRRAQLGPIDVLVNSAGAARRTPPPDLNPEVWRAAFDAKFFSYINVIDPLVRRMAARGRGVVVNIIGAGGKVARLGPTSEIRSWPSVASAEGVRYR